MDLYMSSLGTERPWCVFYATRHQFYWGLRNNTVFSGTLAWYYTHTNTQAHTQHTQGSVHWHTHLNIYPHHLLCAHAAEIIIALND